MKNSCMEWKKYLRNYQFHSIFFKNLLLMMLAITLPFLCIICISLYSYGNIQKEEIRTYSVRTVTQIAADVNEVLRSVKEKAIMLGFDQDIELFLYTDEDAEHIFYNMTNINRFLTMLSTTSGYIDSVYVYSPHNGKVLSQAGLMDYEEFYDKSCLDTSEITENYQIKYNERVVNGKNKKSLSLYYHKLQGHYNGIIVINMDLLKLKRHFNFGEDILFEIVDGNEILYSNDFSQIGVQQETVFAEEMQAQYHIFEEELEDVKLKIRVYIGNSLIQSQLSDIPQYLMFFTIIILLMTVMVGFYISVKMFDPIKTILHVIEKIDLTEIGEDNIIKTENELHYIVNAIQSTADKNKNFEQELEERIRLLKKYQSVALQSQINPHFLNNTLETINWMTISKLGNKNEVSKMINTLSRLLRISLENTDLFISLKDEIQYVEMYLMLQKKRYEDKFEVMWSVPEELMDCKTVKMILQPIVENAIQYGICPYDEKGWIKIEAYQKEELLMILVSDSGFGLNEHELERIHESLKETSIRENEHIGLSNVNQRIRLAFGDAYGVEVSSVLNMGTTVKIKLPYRI